MSIDYFSQDYDPSKLTAEEIETAQNEAILELVRNQIEVQKDYKKVKRLYFFCLASTFFCPIIIFCIYYRQSFKHSLINHRKALAPIFIASISAVFQITITFFFFVQMTVGNSSAESLIAYLVPSFLCSFLLLISFSFSTLFNKLQVKQFINAIEPQERPIIRLSKTISRQYKKITGK